MIQIVDEIFARCRREAVAILADDRSVTFGELEALTTGAAALLGDRSGTRVGLLCPNGIAHIVWSLAVLRSGACLVPVAGELTPSEREKLVASTSLNALLLADGASWHADLSDTVALALPGMEATLATGIGGEPGFDECALRALNPALIRFSSGTTGDRKGVVLSHETLLARVRACNTGLGIGEGDRVIWTLPMAHHFAVSIVLYLLHGATTVLEDSHLGADVYRALTKHQGTVLYGSPFHFALLGAYAEASPVPSLRLAVSTAAALDETVAARFHARFGIPLTQGMGIIEQGLPLLNTRHAADRPTSVGTPQAGFEIRLADGAGLEVATGETGELFLRGPGLFDAYLTPWMPRAEVLRDGYFATGDLAVRDARGLVFLRGRTNAVINVGGMKCFPEEVEAVLRTHEGVAEALVKPMAHPTFGAVPVADIVPKDPCQPPRTPHLMQLCRRELSGYKVPMKYILVTELPKTPSGKLRRSFSDG